MKQFTSVKDVPKLDELLALAQSMKASPMQFAEWGRGKTLCLLFFNPSLRTRLSTQKAAMNLGMNVMVMNLHAEGWNIELEDGTVMSGNTQEHIKEAAGVVSRYCDVIGLRTFASLTDRKKDYEEAILKKFISYASVPLISLESATLHPLQSLADLLTIETLKTREKPKVVLTWAPHPKALPQAVANSFVEWMLASEMELVITHPEGMELAPQFTGGLQPVYNQEEALEGADFVYAKNWSSYAEYGNVARGFDDWLITERKLQGCPEAKFMHCLPVRRNVVVSDAVLDGSQSIVLEQAENRVYAAQAVLKSLMYET